MARRKRWRGAGVGRRHTKRKMTRGGRSEHLDHDDIPGRLPNHFLCVVHGNVQRSYWPAYIPTADANDYEHRVSWEEGIQMLKEDGLTIGIDSGGYPHIRYINQAEKEKVRHARDVIRRNRITVLKRATNEYRPHPAD